MRSPKFCIFPGGCSQPVWARNFCQSHYLQFRNHCIQNHSWSQRDEAEAAVVREPWVYEGDEDALVKMTAAKGKNKD
jgi:hypothetical protein